MGALEPPVSPEVRIEIPPEASQTRHGESSPPAGGASFRPLPFLTAPLQTAGDAQRAQSVQRAVVATQAEFEDDSSCFICMEATRERLHVGRVCDCSTLAVHQHCLEDWINHSTRAATSGLVSRLECNICKHEYRLPYELTTDSGGHYSKLMICQFSVAATVWCGIGAGFGYFAFTAQKSFPGTVLYLVAMVLVCVYAIITLAVYIYMLSRYEKEVLAHKRRMRPRVKFTSGVVESTLPIVATADTAASTSPGAVARVETTSPTSVSASPEADAAPSVSSSRAEAQPQQCPVYAAPGNV
mmetsp:Transcript_11072/g.28984  ORF Transcript_11072/g.28984 Transcript_11072/m.28984 type:complete len:299 (+) Transcript_11072:112-1008(+)